MEIYNNLFGLSRIAPACLAGSELGFGLAEVTTSKSGLYLDEMDNLNLEMLSASADCSKGSIWDLMHQARRNALKELNTALLAGIQTRGKSRYEPYFGNIGHEAYRGSNSLAEGSAASLSLETKPLQSVSATIKRVGLLLNADATVEVTISGLPDPVIIEAVAYKPTYVTLPEPLVLPIDGREFSVSYTVSGFQPLVNMASCGCTVKDRYLTHYFESIIEKPAYGILLDAAISCDPGNLIALSYAQRPDIADVLAYAGRYKAAELLIERILSSGLINRYTMMDPQYLLGKRNHFRKEFQDRINWLISTDGFDLALDSCYVCKTENGFRKRGILV